MWFECILACSFWDLSWIRLYTSWSWVIIFFLMLGKFFTMIMSNIFSSSFSFSSSWIPILRILVCYNVPQRCLRVSSFLSILFFFFSFIHSAALISMIMTSRSLIYFSTSVILLLVISSVFFISIFVLLISVCSLVLLGLC